MELTIVQGDRVIARIKDWQGPVPRAGDYISLPSRSPERAPVNVMKVMSVTWAILARQPGLGHFTGSSDPYVVVTV